MPLEASIDRKLSTGEKSRFAAARAAGQDSGGAGCSGCDGVLWSPDKGVPLYSGWRPDHPRTCGEVTAPLSRGRWCFGAEPSRWIVASPVWLTGTAIVVGGGPRLGLDIDLRDLPLVDEADDGPVAVDDR